ncbi:PAS domain-containing protein [Sphingomonas sp.]|uniref:PAS domain-containing protein n=1 Tax=Sphingomonas sp. TaxID=28214 RepID=UPI002DD653C0|nr:PAS domain-containing protein [Sphingomonas sp.]
MGLRFLDHGGEMGRRIRDHDWAATPLGPLETWPAALRTALGICLSSSHPTAICWGPELLLLYNDTWAPILAERHPASLGHPAAEVWSDVWDVVGPQFAQVITTGDGFSAQNQPLTFIRGGVPVQTWFNYSFSPIRDDGGEVVGIFNEGTETTRFVLAERRQTAETERLRELFHQSPGAVALLRGPDFVYEFANDAYGDLVGHRPLIGRPILEALPEVEHNFLPLLEEVRRTGVAFRADAAEVPLFNREGGMGEIRLLDFVYQPIRGVSGEVADILVQANDVTDRARAEQALRESEERLQLALDSSVGVGTWDWDVPANLVTADARFARLYGVDPEIAATGASIETFFRGIHPDDRPRVQAAIEATLTAGAPFAEEYRLVAGEDVHWVVAQGRARFDAQGRAVRFPGISFDITKRRLAEETARSVADDLRIATETQDFVYRLTDQVRRLDSADEIMRFAASAVGRRMAADRVGFCRIRDDRMEFHAGWTGETLKLQTGSVPLAALGEEAVADYRAGTTRVVADYLKENPHLAQEARQQAGAGIGVPLLRQDGWVAGFYVNQDRPRHWTAEEVALIETVAGIAWDAVDRAEAVTALRESETKFRAIANSIDQMVWSTRPDGYHDYFNDRWYEFTGVQHGSTDGEGWNGMFHPDDRDRAWAVWQHSLRTGEDYRTEYRLRHAGGGYRWVLGRAQAVRDDGGAILRWFGTCTDIQEIMEAREVLALSRADLEQAVIERTEQLMAAEAQLRQAQKMEALGQLTGGIAHDFNNMLAVVIGALDLLDRRIAQGRTDVGRYVEAARDGATRAAALTQRLLGFSRQSSLALTATDLNAVISGMRDMLARTLGDTIVVDTQLAGDWAGHTDAAQLENAIVNLAVNARDAMPGGGRVTIATANHVVDAERAAAIGVPAGDYAGIAVTDTGTGMPPDVAARAFEPFFTTKAIGKGTGLGLSQVFGLVRQSGGHVAIESVAGEGTTVRMLLPRADSPATKRAGPDDRRAMPRGRAEEVVLVVEDEERVRAYSREALAELGYTVVEAASGAGALRLIAGGQPVDLLFTDVMMPGMNGRELADAARERLPGLPVLYTSGYTGDAVDLADAGSGVLTKPFDIAALATRVRVALDAGRQAR